MRRASYLLAATTDPKTQLEDPNEYVVFSPDATTAPPPHETIPNQLDENLHVGGGGFYVSMGVARQCSLLTPILDEIDAAIDQCYTEAGDYVPNVTKVVEEMPIVSIPNATNEGILATLQFLDICQSKAPSVIGRPLRAKLDTLVTEWEWDFLTQTLGPQNPSISNKAADHQLLLEVMNIADYLVCDTLRELCCAYFSHLLLSCRTEQELIEFFGRTEPLSNEELGNTYEQFPFLNPAALQGGGGAQ